MSIAIGIFLIACTIFSYMTYRTNGVERYDALVWFVAALLCAVVVCVLVIVKSVWG